MPEPEWKEKGEVMSPGVYQYQGQLHIDTVEVCDHIGVPPTEENQAKVVEQTQTTAAQFGVPYATEDDLPAVLRVVE